MSCTCGILLFDSAVVYHNSLMIQRVCTVLVLLGNPMPILFVTHSLLLGSNPILSGLLFATVYHHHHDAYCICYQVCSVICYHLAMAMVRTPYALFNYLFPCPGVPTVHTMDCIWRQCVHCAQLVHSGLISYVSVFVHDISHGSSAYTVLYQFSLPIHFMQQ